jgi:Arc/MetJ-type ribon-helix-helix transcriptional regulator
MARALGKIASVTLSPDLRRAIDEFIVQGGFENRSEALRVLLWRGLFIETQPKGKWSQSAWFAAYQSMKMDLVQVAYQKFITEGGFEQFAEEVFREAMRKAGGKFG